MFEKYLPLALAVSIAYAGNTAPACAQSAGGKAAQLAERVKEGVLQLGDGPETYVRVGLRDKTVLSGYIDEANAASFTIIDELTGKPVTVSYSGVKRIMGLNSLTRVTIALGVGRLARLALRDCWKRRKPPVIL